jgi:outer membrane protein assembly factor BamE (lipoprotein component of BamABCDE complex)
MIAFYNRSKLRRAACCGLIGFGLAAAGGCTPTVDVHGNMPEVAQVQDIEPGVTTREQISDKFGTPSTVALFGGETWYYVGKKTETFAFFNPKTLDQRVVAVSFDDRGRVEAVKQIDGDQAESIDVVKRTTPTRGREYTFVEQLLGNVGRFSNSSNKAGGGGSGDIFGN